MPTGCAPWEIPITHHRVQNAPPDPHEVFTSVYIPPIFMSAQTLRTTLLDKDLRQILGTAPSVV